ncbi:MAG: hypothetical protein ACP5XB_10605 [Isosphaeraceae bacterium]
MAKAIGTDSRAEMRAGEESRSMLQPGRLEALERAHSAKVNARRISISSIDVQTKEFAMRRKSMFARLFGLGMADRPGRHGRARSRQVDANVERLESRGLLSGGSVVLSQGLVTITPASVGPDLAVVSYQTHNNATMLDVNLNGVDNYFSLTQVGFVYYKGSGISAAQTFVNRTSLHTVAWGGSGTNVFQAGSGQDTFFGGSGSNTFDAGTGFDVFIGGAGPNVFNENPTGSGEILLMGHQNTVNVPPNATGVYWIV